MRMVDCRWKPAPRFCPPVLPAGILRSPLRLSCPDCWLVHPTGKRASCKKCSCEPQTLPFAAGKSIAEFAHRRVVAFGKGHNKIVNGGLLQAVSISSSVAVSLAIRRLFFDAVVEELGLLRHKALQIAQIFGVDLFHRSARKLHAAFLHLPEPHQKL